MSAILEERSWDLHTSIPLESLLTVRTFIGDRIRRTIGKDLYTRLRHGYEAEHSFLRKIRGLIHIGANEGQERDFYAAFGLDVIWIEPIPEVFATLKSNISGFPKQQAFQYLVADEDGEEFTLHIADNSGASSSILEMARVTEMYPHIAYERTIRLKSATLESIVSAEHIDVRQFNALILDTQGSELKILEGAAALLPAFRFVKVEASDFESYKGCCTIEEVSAFMSFHGFRERGRHTITHTPGIGTYFDVIYEQTRS
jgi:FkbM family methyltransferase